MSINATIFAQIVVFAALVWFTMKFVWPVILGAMEERERTIADGLAAAERAGKDLEAAKGQVDDLLKEARKQAQQILDQANSRSSDIVEEARSKAREEGERILTQARAEIEQETNRGRDALRGEVAAIALAGAGQVLEREISAQDHQQLLDKLASSL